MAELVAKLEELLQLPAEVHWFCDSYECPKASGTPLEADVRQRQEQAADCLKLYSYDDADRYQKIYGRAIDEQLTRCDICIVEYYKARRRLSESLRNDYDEEPVLQLEKSFDDHDFERIKRSLDNVERTLQAVEPVARNKNILAVPDQMGLFEALCNRTFLTDDFLLSKHFQRPFDLVQTNKKLTIPHFVPAATIFLFDKHFDRRSWAKHAWSKYKRKPTRDDFEFAIRDALLVNMQSVLQIVSDPADLERFWSAIGIIVEKLDNDLVTHSLRALEIDVFMLALDHLKYDAPGFRSLIQTIQKLLEIAPKDFWHAMGAISPTTFIEQIFNNPQYDKVIEQAVDADDYDSSLLKDMLSWFKPFMASLETVHQSRACRSVTFQLLDRLQNDRFPQFARVQCYRVGLATLGWTLGNYNKEGLILTPSGRIVATETLEVVGEYVKDFLRIPSLPTTDPLYEECGDKCLSIVKIALALECRSLRTDQEALIAGKELPEGSNAYAPPIWDAVVLHMDRGNIPVARAALVAINDLTGLEKFRVNVDETYTKEKSGFNVKLGRLTHLVCQILERINDFKSNDLDKLFRQPDSATALISSLFSPDTNLYEAGVNLIKSISSASARKEAIGHLLKTFFETTLNAFSWSIRRIARNRTYASCPRMLKTSTDVLEILCDSQDGILRTRGLSGVFEIKAIENYWEHQWEGLKVIYEMMEYWGRAKVAETETLREFCRDTMQFSERFFDQSSVFSNTIDSAVIIKREENVKTDNDRISGKELIKHPTTIMENIIKWLRLRDLFLVEITVNLTTKMLNRLTDVRVVVAEGPSELLQQMVNSSSDARTNLTPQQKAELARALEANVGRPVVTVIDLESEPTSDRNRELPEATMTTKKAATIDLEAWRSKARSSLKVADLSDDEFGDSDIPDADLTSVSQSVEMMNRMKMNQQSLPSKKQPKTPSDRAARMNREKLTRDPQSKTHVQSEADMAKFREKREKERLAKKKRDAETLAMLKKKAAGISVGESLRGNGVKKNDAVLKGPNLMVSSGSESDPEDEIDQELFGKGPKPAKTSSAVREYEASKAKQAKVGPVKKIRQVRSAKDMRARLAPNLTNLHKTILGWDFFHNGDFPPGSDRHDYSFVTSTFKTPLDYQNIFEPLLILEAWQGILKAKDEGNFKNFEIKVASRMNVDAFLELSTSMSITEGKELGIGEADIVLISKGESPTRNAMLPHCFARVYKIKRKKGSMEITYRANVGNGLVSAMVPNAVLYGVKVNSITPLEREYGALVGLKYFDLCDEIIRAKPSPLLSYSEAQLNPLVRIYDVNQAQAKAVRSAVDNDAFTLIQGPPGSGKTKTIVAIVGALLTSTLSQKDRGSSIARPQANGLYQRPESHGAAKKLLICAPSNAAVDELVMRLKQGVKTTTGVHELVNVVRLGRSDAINSSVLDVTLEELVNAKLNFVAGKKAGSGDDIQKIMLAHKATCDEFNALRDQVDASKAAGKDVTTEQNRDFEVLKRKKQQLSNRIDQARDSGDTAARDADIKRRQVQQEVLDSSHVICATLSGSGHEMFQGLNIEFETVVIDEAAQSIELSALIPLKYGCAKCILVGDPKQLPPTVLSREAARFQYEQSLFVRMQANHPLDVHLLDTQYRMHPEISLFPSTTFYDNRLLDGPGMASLRNRPWHQSDLLSPYRFFDVLGSHQNASRGHSLINLPEIEVALKLYDRLITDCRGYDFKGKVGIITPYKSQLRELRSRFARFYGDAIFSAIDFNTTDAFQGRESEIIIFSCVRASSSKGIGFLSDIRRMNVGITRAKSSLWVLGNSQSLMTGEYWGRLIQDAKSRNRFTSGDLAALLSKPLLQHQEQAIAIATIDNDVEMADVDAPDVPGDRSSGRQKSNRYEVSTSESDRNVYEPSGGPSGLNESQNCARCGSYAHITARCDNLEAQELSQGSCYRCGDVGHSKHGCIAKKCITCGKVGHTQQICTSETPLPKRDQDRIRKQERERDQLRSNSVGKSVAAMERARKNQLGEHDKAVPVVRSSSDLFPSEKTHNHKRKRDHSPSLTTAPKGPRIADTAHKADKSDPTQSTTTPSTPSMRKPNYAAGDPRAPKLSSFPNQISPHAPGTAQPPSFVNGNQRPTATQPNSTPSISEPSMHGQHQDTIGTSDSDTVRSGPGNVLKGARTPRAESTIIRQGDGLPKIRRPESFPQGISRTSNVKAPKRKKEADPFIRPKKR